MATAKSFKPTPDQVKLIVRGLSSLSDISKRAERAAKIPAIADILSKEQLEIATLVNSITTSELEL